MFCPQCGYAQPVDEMMYCPSCGFTLRSVKQLLLTGGELSAETEADKGAIRRLLSRRGMKQGLVLWMIGAFVVPLLGTSDAPDAVMGASSIVFFVGGFLLMLYAWLFQETHKDYAPSKPRREQPPLVAPATQAGKSRKLKFWVKPSALPAADLAATRLDTARQRTTGQLVQPPSVTDRTTRLLDKNSSR